MLDLIVRDFQAVKEVKLRIKGFTVLKGPSNSGKSSTIKAFYAATHNRFGSNQVRVGEDSAVVKVRWEGKEPTLSVMRKWSGASPIMKLGENTYHKLSRNVPSEVEEFNNFGSLQAGSDKYSLNFFVQFQKPLLLEYSQRRVMEILSASVAMSELDLVHKRLAELRSENRGAFDSVDSIITDTKAKLSETKFKIGELEPVVNQIKEKLSKVEQLLTRKEALSQARRLVDSLQCQKDKDIILKEMVSVIQALLDKGERKQALSEISERSCNIVSMHGICSLLGTLIGVNNELESNVKRHKMLMSIKGIKMPSPNFMEVLDKRITGLDKLDLLMASRNMCRSLQTLVDTQKMLTINVEKAEKILNNNLCPLCGNKL